MTSPSPSWPGRTIIDSPVPQLLSTRSAIVLERLARGGGAATWYHCPDRTRLAALAARLRAGSVVSFYFDDRIIHRPYTADVHAQMLQLMRGLRDVPAQTGEIVVGHLDADQLQITVDYPSAPEDLDEFTQTLTAGSWVYFGPFPARDNDGTNAVTLTLPDPDGITRAHPH